MDTADSVPPLTTPEPMQAPAAQPPDPAQASLVSALRSSFAVLRLVMLVLVILYAISGVFRIEPGDQGIIVRLGQLKENQDKSSEHFGTPIHDQGWVWAVFPDPIDEKIRLPGSVFSLETDAFLFQRREEDLADNTDISTIRQTGRVLRPGQDGAHLTGDKNLSHGLWTVEYRIVDAAKFVTNIGEKPADFEPMLKRLFESAILREVAYRKVEDVTRTKRDIVVNDVRRRLQNVLNSPELDVGVTIVKVNANTIVPPQVAPAFDEVTRAESERTRQEDAARQIATEVLNQAAGPQHRELLNLIQRYGAARLTDAAPERLAELRAGIDVALDEAQGAVAAQLREASSQANSIREEIRREQREFTVWLEQYRMYPELTRVKLWSAMQEAILGSNQNEVFWVPDADVIEILLNRDPNLAIEAERELYQREVPGLR